MLLPESFLISKGKVMQTFNSIVLLPISMCWNFASSLYLYRLMGFIVEYRKKTKYLLIIWSMFLFALPIYNADVTNVLGLLTAFLFIILVCTKGSLINRLAVVLIFFPLILGLNYMVYNNPAYAYMIHVRMLIYEGVNSFMPADYLSCLAVTIFLGFLKLSAWFFLYYCFMKRLKQIKGYMTGKIWMIVAVICTASFISMVTGIMFPPMDAKTIAEFDNNAGLSTGTFGTFTVVVSGMISIIGILYLLRPLIENVKNTKKLQIEGLKEEYYRSLEEQQDSVRRLRHDMKNHFQAVRGCLEQGDVTGAREYLEQFGRILPSGGGRQFCHDRALNAVLNSRFEKLKELKADSHFNLEIDGIMEITSLELCTIFSNAIDNAIEAVKKIPESRKRRVLLQARNIKGYFSLRITNSKDNRIEIENGKIITDKKQPGHGYGIENIREIVERYGGNLDTSYTEDSFVLFLYLRL